MGMWVECSASRTFPSSSPPALETQRSRRQSLRLRWLILRLLPSQSRSPSLPLRRSQLRPVLASERERLDMSLRRNDQGAKFSTVSPANASNDHSITCTFHESTTSQQGRLVRRI